jgi:hypothetical protein
MKIFIRALFGVAAVFVFALANQTSIQVQNRIEDRFANVNGVTGDSATRGFHQQVGVRLKR